MTPEQQQALQELLEKELPPARVEPVSKKLVRIFKTEMDPKEALLFIAKTIGVKLESKSKAKPQPQTPSDESDTPKIGNSERTKMRHVVARELKGAPKDDDAAFIALYPELHTKYLQSAKERQDSKAPAEAEAEAPPVAAAPPESVPEVAPPQPQPQLQPQPLVPQAPAATQPPAPAPAVEAAPVPAQSPQLTPAQQAALSQARTGILGA
jgi:hypothetical protein